MSTVGSVRSQSGATQDIWSRWLLEKRFGGDAEAAQKGLEQLRKIRDRVLDGARLAEGDTVLDVGAGDGLIAFGALDGVGANGRVIFSDISGPLLDRSRRMAEELGVLDRCEFVDTDAETLTGVADGSVDAVTTRSVLIYVKDKEAAFRAFKRVLKPGGRISLFEPINRLTEELSPYSWWSDIPEIKGLSDRLLRHFRSLQPPDTDPMLDFDDRDLVRLCMAAGLTDVLAEVEIRTGVSNPMRWETAVNVPGNPKIPSLAEAMADLFTPEEARSFESYLRPLVETGGRATVSAVAFVRATKATEGAS